MAEQNSSRSDWSLKCRTVGTKILDISCIVSGSFFLLIYFPYFIFHLFKTHPADIAVSLLVFVGVLAPYFTRKYLKKLLKKWYLPLKILWGVGMCLYMITFLIFTVVIFSADDIPPSEDERQPIVIVFGCQVSKEHGISAELKGRLDTAAAILSDDPRAICVVTGGKGKDEPIAEADAMADYLIEKKMIDKDRIISENRSHDTIENIRFSAEKLKNEGYVLENCSIICVSSDFHTPRISFLFGRITGCPCATVSSDTPYRFNLFVYTVREYMSYVCLLLFGI